MKTSVQGDTVRSVAAHLATHFPSLPPEVARHLRVMAVRYDRAALLAETSSRRWVRRQVGNGGPGTRGIGHIAAAPVDRLDLAEAVCGTRLTGRLDWGRRVSRLVSAPDTWRPCSRCTRSLFSERGAA